MFDAWEKKHKLILNGGLMVIYHGTICKKTQTKNTNLRLALGRVTSVGNHQCHQFKNSLFSAQFAGIHLAISCCFRFFQVYNSLEKVAGKGASFHCYKKKLLVDIIIL